MSLQRAIHDLCIADATIGGMVANRCRPLIGAELDVRPLLLYSVTAGESTATYQGPSTYQKSNVQFGIYGDSEADCIALAAAVKSLFDGKALNGTGIRIAPALLDDETDIEAVGEPGKSTYVYVCQHTYRMLWRNA